MKRLVLTAMIAAFSFTAIQAQDGTATKAEAKKLKEEKNIDLQKAINGLSLSEEQKLKMKALQETHQLQMEEIKKEGVPREKIEAIRKDQHEQILSVLNDSQKAELEKIITEERTEKVRTTNSKDELIAKLKAVQQNTNLTEEQKQSKTKELMESAKGQLSEEDLQKVNDKLNHNLQKKAPAPKPVN